MAAIDAAVATFERNIETATGKTIPERLAAIARLSLEKHGAIVAWLKSEHGLSRSHADHLAKRAREVSAPRSTDDPVAHLFAGGREALRPLDDRLVAAISAFGPDVENQPRRVIRR